MDKERFIPDAQTVVPALAKVWLILAGLLALALFLKLTGGALSEGLITSPCLG